MHPSTSATPIPLTRRDALQRAAAFSLLAVAPAGVSAAGPARMDDVPSAPAGAGQTDRDFVIAAGMTEEEAACWAAIADAAGKFFALPELHPMDRQEVASAIHIVQNKLLSRPTYRRYLELARAAHGG